MSKRILAMVATGFVFMLVSNAILSNLPSYIFSSASGQEESNKNILNNNTNNNRGNSIQSVNDERTAQALENAKKLRKVSGENVPNQYIVVLKNREAITPSTSLSASTSARSAAEEARNQGATLRHIYEHAINGYAIRVPNQQVLDRILANPAVDYVQPDKKMKAFAQTLPKGINRVDGDLSPTKSGDGSGSVNSDIAILDTGIDTSHPDLFVYKQVTFVSGTSSGNDDNGHGTMVAGVSAAKDNSQGVVGIAPGARLWAVKVLDRNGEGFDSDIIKGVDYVTDHKNEIDSVNLSFGGDGPDDALHTAISNSVAAGVTYAVAAGNEATDAKSFVPASFPEVITVSAIADSDGKCGSQGSSTSFGPDDTLASFSNYGSIIDLTAPGVDIQTTYKGSSYRSFSGTSASTPFVTGAAALYKSTHPGATPAGIRNALTSSGSTPSTVCDGKGHGYFKGDRDNTHEPLLYLGSSTSADTTLPTVTSTSPGGGTSNIQVNSVIKVTFSEPMLASSISTNTFTLRIADTTTKLGGAVSLSQDRKTATFDPSPNLATSTRYVATISTGATDLAGNALSESKKWSFTTGGVAQSDTTSSTVASTNPADGASTHPSVASSSQSQSHLKDSKDLLVIKNAEKETVPTTTTNNAPIAKDDRLRAVANMPVVGKILDNDIDPDGNKLKIISVTSPTKNDGTVIINKNGTVTFLPATDFVGIDSFTYTVSDGDGKKDNGKVSIIVKAPIEQHSQEKINPKTAITKEQLIAESERGITEKQNQIRRDIHVDNANSQEIHKRVLSNESLS